MDADALAAFTSYMARTMVTNTTTCFVDATLRLTNSGEDFRIFSRRRATDIIVSKYVLVLTFNDVT